MYVEPVLLVYLCISVAFAVTGGLISAKIIPPKAASKLAAQLYYCFGLVYFLQFLAGYNRGKGNYLDITHYPYVIYALLIFFSLGVRTLTRYASFISHQSNLESLSKKLSSFLMAAIVGTAVVAPLYFEGSPRPFGIVLELTGVVVLVQCVFCLRIVRANSKSVVHFYADSEQVSLRWLAWTILLFMVLGGFVLVAPLMRPFLDQMGFYGSSAFTQVNIVSLLAIVLFVFLAIKILRQNEIDDAVVEYADFVQPHVEDQNPAAPTGEPATEGKPADQARPAARTNPLANLVDPQTMDSYWERIVGVMESQRPFLIYGFSVAQLAELTNIKRYQLSFTINAKSGLAFQEFVNNYRVKHAMQMLQNPEFSSSPIKSIMIESGFRSSSVFHGNFRRVTGLSPVEFRASLRKD